MENEIIKDLKRIQKNSTRNVLVDFTNASLLAKYKFPNPGDTYEFDQIMKNYKTSDSILMGYYGQLVFESGKSSIYSYECGCDELKKLYEIMWNTDGIYGGRFSGAGFKGRCMALGEPEKVEDIKVKVAEEYLKAFPELEGRYSAYVCESADGVRL